MKVSQIRSKFIEYFNSQGHKEVASSSLIPGNDPSLLFTNAGMVQFKDVFLGFDKRDYKRAVTSQRCVRAGGKHNDLENVGYTARHHTFFEMLGNFSFGDYFKQEAIEFAWNLLTKELGLPKDKLWITVFEEDDEAEDIWVKHIGVPKERVIRIGAKDNFWAMGDTGPCGPCSEIFYDHGEDVAGGPPGSPDEDGDRYIEIWNLVFMQYNRDADGVMTPLPKPCVDTGMGLERIAAVLQHVHSNYEIDLFVNLISAAAKVTNSRDLKNKSLAVIADHIRSTAFLIVDGVTPSNEGRGYVLRRIIRRAIRHGYQLGCQTPFMHLLIDSLISEMGEAYPELVQQKAHLEKILYNENERFLETLDLGLGLLDKEIAVLSDKQIPGDVIFKLYDTYGFPVDLTNDVARERGLTLDLDGFESCMSQQRQQARSANSFVSKTQVHIDGIENTLFNGYTQTSGSAKIIALQVDDRAVKTLTIGKQAVLVLDQTPFYAESGGQTGDKGIIKTATAEFKVCDTQKFANKVIGHIGQVIKGEIKIDDEVVTQVNDITREQTQNNHSATHLLHAALRVVLGDHVQQKGSLVESERLRFDFSHYEPITSDQLSQVGHIVNQQIRHNCEVTTTQMDLEEAKEKGAQALFGEKYEDQVRVVAMDDFSLELCGGTHVSRTGNIGLFSITSETGIAAGVRRIEAITAQAAIDWSDEQHLKLNHLSQVLKTNVDSIEHKIEQLLQKNRELEKDKQQLQSKNTVAIYVEKYGGTSVANVERINAVADNVERSHKLGHKLVVVLSAMSGETNRLLGLAKEIHPDAGAREIDVLVSTGEQVTISLLAMALQKRGIDARSYTGGQ
eukprot:maker-scaffold1010_size71100-snap-gene-0.3 protein:Tk12543 transcript:maker-scaffold1010_size71100-snap-gene-0.3-mRNA-1 annotation:"alanyl-trna synthetase"